jgi:CSLREA domain-containing protein
VFRGLGASFAVLLIALMLVFLPVESAQAAAITVDTTADELNADGDCALREAIQAANTDTAVDSCAAGSGVDMIVVPAGTYTLGIGGNLEDANATGDLDITASLTINGAGSASTVVDGADLDRVLHVVGGTVAISGVTIQNGTSSIPGGACTPGSGGGIRNSGTLSLANVTVTDNLGQGCGGGGINNTVGATLTIDDSIVSDNWTNACCGDGGGGILNEGTLIMNRSTVKGNLVAGQSGDGGGIHNRGVATLTNLTVSGNESACQGGGIMNGRGGGIATVTNLTITNNTVRCSLAGGGIGNNGPGSATVKNTIVANNTRVTTNTPDNCGGPSIFSAGHNLSGDGTCPFGAPGDLNNTDPLLGPLADNGGPTPTHALLAGSPAIDAGSPDCPPPTTDQRGVARPQGTACDIGAFEAEAAPVRIAFASNRDSNFEIYSMNADGSGQTRLTTNPALDATPGFSPDGTKIAFASSRTGNGDIYVMNANGSAQTRLTASGATDAEPTWSPDGTRIAFASSRTGNGDIYVMNANGSAQTRRTTSAAVDSSPDWSNDGTKLAFASRRDGNFEIYSMNSDGSGQTRLTTNPAVDAEPAFLATGKLAFASNRDGNFELYSMNPDGSGQTRLTTNPAADISPDAS